MTKKEPAEGPRKKADPKGCKGCQGADGRVEFGKEQLVEDERRRGPINKKIIPFQRRADRRRERDSREARPPGSMRAEPRRLAARCHSFLLYRRPLQKSPYGREIMMDMTSLHSHDSRLRQGAGPEPRKGRPRPRLSVGIAESVRCKRERPSSQGQCYRAEPVGGRAGRADYSIAKASRLDILVVTGGPPVQSPRGSQGSAEDSPAEMARFELVWGFSCQAVVWVVLTVFCSERERPFFVPSPAIRFAERAEGVKGPKR